MWCIGRSHARPGKTEEERRHFKINSRYSRVNREERLLMMIMMRKRTVSNTILLFLAGPTALP